MSSSTMFSAFSYLFLIYLSMVISITQILSLFPHSLNFFLSFFFFFGLIFCFFLTFLFYFLFLCLPISLLFSHFLLVVLISFTFSFRFLHFALSFFLSFSYLAHKKCLFLCSFVVSQFFREFARIPSSILFVPYLIHFLSQYFILRQIMLKPPSRVEHRPSPSNYAFPIFLTSTTAKENVLFQ